MEPLSRDRLIVSVEPLYALTRTRSIGPCDRSSASKFIWEPTRSVYMASGDEWDGAPIKGLDQAWEAAEGPLRLPCGRLIS
jgi:hypothetical protein